MIQATLSREGFTILVNLPLVQPVSESTMLLFTAD